MDYEPAIKRNELFIPATTWMNLKSIMLSARLKALNVIYCMTPFW